MAIFEFFRHRFNISVYFDLRIQIAENMVLVSLKIFIFNQVMAKNFAHAQIWAYVFWP